MNLSLWEPLPEPQQAECIGCHGPFLRSFPLVRYCEACREHREQEEAKAREREAARQRVAWWERTCPAEYQETELSRLPRLDTYDRVQAWRYGPRGLVLHGPTGLGKSRAAWALCRREVLAGRTLCAITPAVVLRIPGWCGSGEYESRFERAARADLCLLDDAFKSRLSPAAEEYLCALVEERTSRQRPLIVTLNDTGDSLLRRLSEDRGEPLVRRLRDYCDAVEFTLRRQNLPTVRK